MIKECLIKLQIHGCVFVEMFRVQVFNAFFVQFLTANLSPIVSPFLQSHLSSNFLLLVFVQFSPQIWFLPFSPHIWSLYIIIAYTPPIFSYISSHFLTNNCRPLKKKHLKKLSSSILLIFGFIFVLGVHFHPRCSFLFSVLIFVLGVHFCPRCSLLLAHIWYMHIAWLRRPSQGDKAYNARQ